MNVLIASVSKTHSLNHYNNNIIGINVGVGILERDN